MVCFNQKRIVNFVDLYFELDDTGCLFYDAAE